MMSPSSIEIDFDRVGWNDFTKIPMSRSATTTHSLSVVNSRGRVTGVGSDGNLREALVINGTSQWGPTGLKSLWWGPSPGQISGTRSQIGHIHNVQQSGTRTFGVLVFHDTAFGFPGIINVNRATFATDGSDVATGTQTLVSGANTRLTSLGRSGRVTTISRTTNVGRYTMDPPHVVAGVQVGDTFTIAGAANATFNVTNAVVTAVEPENGIVECANAGANASENCAPGVTYAPTGTYRNNMPYWVRSHVWNDTVWVKSWSYGLPEPSWSDPSAVTKSTLGLSATYTSDAKSRVMGRGPSGFMFGHNHDNQYTEVSDVEAYSLS